MGDEYHQEYLLELEENSENEGVYEEKDKSQNKRQGENSSLNRELASFWSPGERYGNRIIYDVGFGLNCKVKNIIGNGL